MKTRTTSSIDRRRSRGRCPDGSANPVDVYVGQRLELRRKLLHLSQEIVAKNAGITFQQIQKYEKGKNRISASRLYDLCKILRVDMNYFFQDMPSDISLQSPMNLSGAMVENNNIFLQTPPELTSEAQQLLTHYYRIHRSSVTRAIQNLLKALAQTSFEEK
jgi:transcriptional regulator with XRE-family HTH domain